MPPAIHEIIFATFAFVLGSAIGSFLNVCIYRMPLGMSVNEPKRSFCPSCKYQIPWYHNLPLFSWLMLRGRCANCGAKISARYFGVELLTGLLFLGVWWRVWLHPRADGIAVLVLPFWIFVSLLVVATFVDFEHYIIPDEITWGGTIAGLMLSFVIPQTMGGFSDLHHWLATLPGLVIWLGCTWLGNHLGGPLSNIRSPMVFNFWFLAGAGTAGILATFLGESSGWRAPAMSLAGAVLGYLVLWGVVEAGKKVFGKKTFAMRRPSDFTWIRREVETERGKEQDADLVVGDVSWKSAPKPPVWRAIIRQALRLLAFLGLKKKQEVERGESWVWSETFSRDSDQLVIEAQHFEIDGESFSDSRLVFSWNELKVGDRTWMLEQTGKIIGVAKSLVFPREAMGFGDVKFIAAIGAFLGWKAVGFTIMSASTIGALVGIASIAIGRREFSAKIPFGPYLALGALIWLFCGPEIVRWYFDAIAPPPGL